MTKLNAKQERKIREREKEFERQVKPVNDFFRKYVKKSIREGIESMMYNKKSKDLGVRKWDELLWFAKIVFIFLGLREILDILTEFFT